MAYDEGLGQRLDDYFEDRYDIEGKKMFGGVGYMLNGNMCVGVNGDNLIVRVGPDNHDEALSQPHTRVFDLTGKAMKGWIFVAPDGFESDGDLAAWVEQGVAFAASLPPK